LIIVVINYYC